VHHRLLILPQPSCTPGIRPSVRIQSQQPQTYPISLPIPSVSTESFSSLPSLVSRPRTLHTLKDLRLLEPSQLLQRGHPTSDTNSLAPWNYWQQQAWAADEPAAMTASDPVRDNQGSSKSPGTTTPSSSSVCERVENETNQVNDKEKNIESSQQRDEQPRLGGAYGLYPVLSPQQQRPEDADLLERPRRLQKRPVSDSAVEDVAWCDDATRTGSQTRSRRQSRVRFSGKFGEGTPGDASPDELYLGPAARRHIATGSATSGSRTPT
jgi:hypothetical protein